MCETAASQVHPALLLSCPAHPLVPRAPITPKLSTPASLGLRLQLPSLVLGSGSICMVEVSSTSLQLFPVRYLLRLKNFSSAPNSQTSAVLNILQLTIFPLIPVCFNSLGLSILSCRLYSQPSYS